MELAFHLKTRVKYRVLRKSYILWYHLFKS